MCKLSLLLIKEQNMPLYIQRPGSPSHRLVPFFLLKQITFPIFILKNSLYAPQDISRVAKENFLAPLVLPMTFCARLLLALRQQQP